MADNKSNSSDEIMDIDDSISASMPSRTVRSIVPDVIKCMNMLEAIGCILYNNTYQKNIETLTETQVQIFEIIEQLRECPQKMFMFLRKHFATQFDIDLYIIAYENGKFSLINQDNYNKKKMAFLSFNEDNTVCGPLYTVNVNGTKKTVFSSNNNDIRVDVYVYVTQLNSNKSSTGFPRIQEQQAVPCVQELIENSVTENISASTNQFNQSNPDQVDNKTQSRIVLKQMLQQMFRIMDGLPIDPHTSSQVLQSFVSHIDKFKHLSPQDAIMASKDGIKYLLNLVQLAEQSLLIYQNEQVNMPQSQFPNNINNQDFEIQNQTNQTLSNAEVPLNTSLPNDVLTTTANINNSTIETPVNILTNYGPPEIPKLNSTRHPRNFREFAQTGSSPITFVGYNERDPLQIGVPEDDGVSLYLGVEVVDLSGQTHPSKVIVPDGTKVDNEDLMNNNDLRCLNFNRCHKDYIFECETKHLYSKIHPKERQALQKKKNISIHMINFYQRRGITKERIKNEDLKKCRLAFWYCILENGEFKRVSPVSYSDQIEDCIKATGKKKIIKKKPKRLSKTSIDVH